MEFSFKLNYQLSSDDANPDEVVERLGHAGCTDALVGIGKPGRLTIEFTRAAPNRDAAVASAQYDVKCAIPTATLIETSAQKAVTAFFAVCEQARKQAQETAVREELARAFETALAAVFAEAKPQHGLDAKYVRYRQILHGVHVVEFHDDDGEVYDAAYLPNLQLANITRVRDWHRVWERG
jgi:hypothetical protein